jgi:hypothetical protein
LTKPVTQAKSHACSSSTCIIEDRDPSTHLNILTIRGTTRGFGS